MSNRSKSGAKRKGNGSTGSRTDFSTPNPYAALSAVPEVEEKIVSPARPVAPPSGNDLLASTGATTVSSSSAGGARSASPSAVAQRLLGLTASAMSSSTVGSDQKLSGESPLVSASSPSGIPASSPSGIPASSLLGSTQSAVSSSASGLSAPALGRRGGAPPAPIRNLLVTNFGRGHPPLTDHDDSFALLINYVDVTGHVQRRGGLIRNMMAPDESRVLSVVASLDPATNGVRTKPVAERGVMQGDTVYHNFAVGQDLVMSNTAVASASNEVVGVAMVTQGEQVEGDPINFAVAFAGSTSLIFRGFKLTDESPYTAEPGHRFGLDFSAAAEEKGRVDGIKRHVNVHRRARGAAGFCSSYFTALSPGVPGHKIHSIIDF